MNHILQVHEDFEDLEDEMLDIDGIMRFHSLTPAHLCTHTHTHTHMYDGDDMLDSTLHSEVHTCV